VSEPITDYYGRSLSVEALMCAPGPMVDLDIKGPISDGEFIRLTPEQAIEMGDRLREAGEAEL
jgi:hypothetical protein